MEICLQLQLCTGCEEAKTNLSSLLTKQYILENDGELYQTRTIQMMHRDKKEEKIYSAQ